MAKIYTIEVTPFVQNCRIVAVEKGAAVVDPGGDVPRILEVVDSHGLTVEQIWLTHSHLDHVGGVRELQRKTGARIYGHRLEKDYRERVEDICRMYGVPPGIMENCPEPDTYIDEGDTVEIGGERFQVLFTPGHSPGHVCFYRPEEKVLLAGDTVFEGSIGRTDLPGGVHSTLMKSIMERIMTLPPETVIMPGHGPDTTVARELRSNPFILGEL